METDHRLSHSLLAERLVWPERKSSKPCICRASWKAVEVLDEARCRDRANNMRQALRLVEDGLSSPSLSLEKLSLWHSAAAPEVGLRTEPWAFAKGGEERYSLDNLGLERRLLALDSDNALARSLKAYLDILFFHPFRDGNSRTARLAFHHFACLDGLEFVRLDPLFRLAIPAGNQRAYALFFKLAESCIPKSSL